MQRPDDRPLARLRSLLSLLAPPLCVACGADCGEQAHICSRCETALHRLPIPPPIPVPSCDTAWAAAPHQGVARELVVALKFRRLLPVAETIARRIVALAPATLLVAEFVPVAPAPARLARRGFDPAEEIARCRGAHSGSPLCRCLEREEGSRQVGRSRAARIARPPSPRVLGRPPASAVLVDDVQTTGATLAACARALREAGTEQVSALTFARTL